MDRNIPLSTILQGIEMDRKTDSSFNRCRRISGKIYALSLSFVKILDGIMDRF
jgi:hypothetical protein